MNPQKVVSSSSTAFSNGFLPQRPSSVQLPTQSAYRGIPQPMTRNKSNPLIDNPGSSFNDLVGLLDTQTFVPLPVSNTVKQPSVSRPSSYHGITKTSLGSKDPFATLAGPSGLKNSYTPTPVKPQSGFSWGRKSPQIPQQEEVDDEFGDFTEASVSPAKTPTLPSKALQDSGNGFRRSLSISALHISSIPNQNAFSISTASSTKNISKENLSSSGQVSLSLFDTNSFKTSTTATQQPTTSALDDDFGDDFGDFIASPTKTEFPISTTTPESSISPVQQTTFTRTTPQTPTTSIPLGLIPLPTSCSTTTISTQKQRLISPALLDLPPLSSILTPFPSIFIQPSTFLFSKLTQFPYPLRQRVLSHPQTRDFLLGTCEVARVAGRLIAGSKSRLKKTKLGRGGGDLEAQKEDREIAELVRIWKEECAGRLKAAMVTPRSTMPSHNYSASDPTAAASNPNASRVPELELDLKAEKVNSRGGSILDEEDRACNLCGLHQNELVGRLHEHEFGVPGRWWVRGWGHRGCLRWWEEWEGKLTQKTWGKTTRK